MKTWFDSVYDNAIGKTKGTFDAINTNATGVKIQKKTAQYVIGFLISAVLCVVTDAEVQPNPIIRVTNKALGITNEDIVIPTGSNDNDANTPYAPFKTVFVPFRCPPGKESQLFGSEFQFSISASSTNTGGFGVGVTVIYSDAPPDQSFIIELMCQRHGQIDGGAYAADAAKAHGTANSAVTLTSITIPAGVKQLRGMLAAIQPNGITAADPILALFEFQCSGIEDFSPQFMVACTNWAAALGTVAEGATQSAEGRYYPTRFDVPNQELTVSVSSMIGVAAGGAPDTTQGIVYSR